MLRFHVADGMDYDAWETYEHDFIMQTGRTTHFYEKTEMEVCPWNLRMISCNRNCEA